MSVRCLYLVKHSFWTSFASIPKMVQHYNTDCLSSEDIQLQVNNFAKTKRYYCYSLYCLVVRRAILILCQFRYPNGSPMQSPMGSPMGSSLMLDERTTPMMELSPPGMHDPCSEAGSLPNLQHHGMGQQQQPPPFYHQTIGQRHSTGGALIGGPRLTPATARTPESQSAPTSPANNLDPSQHMQWHGTRTFSNSPESLDIPRLVLTNPEGTNGPHFECFNDLQHLTLDANDMQILCNGTGNGNSAPQVGFQEFSHFHRSTGLSNSSCPEISPFLIFFNFIEKQV
ncbi:unnamed protein product [Heligmosomoides polygyrus]|uniref:Uncharacterized protein n=1 Tax=Heligmosomoides polygyrus TaxID=6339 RepID=A0A3P7YYR6_HELPZ|nr:unnamed protein product [Heligmosomoides polygyrus]